MADHREQLQTATRRVKIKYSNSLFFRALSDGLSSNYTLMGHRPPHLPSSPGADGHRWARLRLHTVLLSNDPCARQSSAACREACVRVVSQIFIAQFLGVCSR